MTGNYFTLKLLAKRLDELLPGQRLREVFSQERDELVLVTDADPSHLVISCRPGENTMFLHPGYTRARSNTADLMEAATGRTILHVMADPTDRVVSIRLEESYTLVCQFFGGRANVLLTGGNGQAVDSFRKGRADEPHRPGIKPETPLFDIVHLRHVIESSADVPLSKVVRQAIPQLGHELVRELMHRCTLPEDTRAGDVPASGVSRLTATFGELLGELENPRPVVYDAPEGSSPLFSPVPLRAHADRGRREYNDIHDAVRYTVYRRRALLVADKERSGIMDTLQKEIDRLDRAIRSLDEARGEQERADLYERYGGLLLSRPDAVPRGASSVEVNDGDARHVIELDPRITAVRNAQRYFDRAKRARAARDEARLRRPQLVERRTLALQLLEGVGQLRSREELKVYAAERREELTAFGIGPKAREREQIPFRIFTVDGGFEVWAGKSSENNDLLTLRHAKPNDLWFHARGAGGSHVILRVGTGAGEPGKRARQQAASIAAYYSKMRNAGSVPVAMTLRKFVRKPRGAPAGTVALEREEVLFVPPQLPAGGSSDAHTRRAPTQPH
jgi:predicted ribosome quality control (RQC) complex YloA/Tae2 family protein